MRRATLKGGKGREPPFKREKRRKERSVANVGAVEEDTTEHAKSRRRWTRRRRRTEAKDEDGLEDGQRCQGSGE